MSFDATGFWILYSHNFVDLLCSPSTCVPIGTQLFFVHINLLGSSVSVDSN